MFEQDLQLTMSDEGKQWSLPIWSHNGTWDAIKNDFNHFLRTRFLMFRYFEHKMQALPPDLTKKYLHLKCVDFNNPSNTSYAIVIPKPVPSKIIVITKGLWGTYLASYGGERIGENRYIDNLIRNTKYNYPNHQLVYHRYLDKAHATWWRLAWGDEAI